MKRQAYRFDGTACSSGAALAREDAARGLKARAVLESLLTAHVAGALGTPPGVVFDGQDDLVSRGSAQSLLELYETDAAMRLPISIDGHTRLVGRPAIVAVSSIRDADPIIDAFNNARPATGAHLDALDAHIDENGDDERNAVPADNVIHSQTLENIIHIEMQRDGYVLLVSPGASLLDGADADVRARVLQIDMSGMEEHLALMHEVAEQEGDRKAVRAILDLSDSTSVSKAVVHVCRLAAILRPSTKVLVVFPLNPTKSQEIMIQRASLTLRALLGGSVTMRHLERAAQRDGKDIDAIIASV